MADLLDNPEPRPILKLNAKQWRDDAWAQIAEGYFVYIAWVEDVNGKWAVAQIAPGQARDFHIGSADDGGEPAPVHKTPSPLLQKLMAKAVCEFAGRKTHEALVRYHEHKAFLHVEESDAYKNLMLRRQLVNAERRASALQWCVVALLANARKD